MSHAATEATGATAPQTGSSSGGAGLIRIVCLVIALVFVAFWVKGKWNEADAKNVAAVQPPQTRTISFGPDFGEEELFPANAMVTWGGSTRPFRVRNRAGLEVGSNELEKLAEQLKRPDPGANQVLQLKSEDGKSSGKVVVTVKSQ